MIVKTFINGVDRPCSSAEVKREGTRALDQASFQFPGWVTVAQGDTIQYLQDIADLQNLRGVWNFADHVKDESGFNNHGTITNVTYNHGNDASAVFDGTAYVTIPDSVNVDFTGLFDIYILCSPNGLGVKHCVFSKSDGFNGIQIFIDSAGKARVEISVGGVISIINGSSVFSTINFTLLRVKREQKGVIKMFVKNTQEGATIFGLTANLGGSTDMYFGRTYNGSGSEFIGRIRQIRIYKDTTLGFEDATAIFEQIRSRTIMKFAGKAWTIDDHTHSKNVVCKSLASVLAEQDIQGTTTYVDKTPEFIIDDLITTHGDGLVLINLIPASSFTLDTYVAEGRLIDNISYLITLMDGAPVLPTFYTEAIGVFRIEPPNFYNSGILFQNGQYVVTEDGRDDTQKVNRVEVIGQSHMGESTKNFGIQTDITEITLDNYPVNTFVTDGGVEIPLVSKLVENSPIPPTTLIFQDDYTTNSGWTQVNTNVTVDDPSFPNICKFNDVHEVTVDRRVFKSLGVTLPATWQHDFDFKLQSPTSFPAHAIVTLADTPGATPPSLFSCIGAGFGDGALGGSGTGLSLFYIENGGAGLVFGNEKIINLVTNTQYYCRLQRTSATTIRLGLFTNVARTISFGSPIDMIIPSTIINLDTLQHANFTDGGPGRTLTCEIDNTKIYESFDFMPDISYRIDTDAKKLIFSTGHTFNSLIVKYQHESTIQSTLDLSGGVDVKSRRIIAPFLRTQDEANKYAQLVLTVNSIVNQQINVVAPTLICGIDDNTTVDVLNTDRKVPGTSVHTIDTRSLANDAKPVIKSITWKYPEGKTIMSVGEYEFDYLESDKSFVENIQNINRTYVTQKNKNSFDDLA